jgi:TrmH family RNA methyltransferase
MPTLGTITSPDNAQARAARALRDRRRARQREGRFIAEGVRLIEQALIEGARPLAVYYTAECAASEAGRSLLAVLEAEGALWQASAEVMASLTDTVTPQGIVALFPLPEPDPAAAQRASLLLVLDAVQDPGNLGAILRTAQAADVDAVVLSRGCVDPYSPKVVRAGMGAHFGLSLYVGLDWTRIAALLGDRPCALAATDGERYPWELDWTGPCALIVGSEARGASAEAQALATHTVRLPMRLPVESLNAAMAAAQLLYEVQRQRMTAAT